MGLIWAQEPTRWHGKDVRGDLYAVTSGSMDVRVWITPWGCGLPDGLWLDGYPTAEDAKDAADLHVVAYVDAVGSVTVHVPPGQRPHPPSKQAAQTDMQATVARLDARRPDTDVIWEIRVLRTLSRYGGLRYEELLRRLGNPTRTSSATTTLERAGYLAEHGRRLRVTATGDVALRRLDDQAIRETVLAGLLYGH